MSTTISIFFFYPAASRLLSSYTIQYYTYEPRSEIIPLDTSKLPPAIAVPILMYHGVHAEPDLDNTIIQSFISQMEMLKREGYTTISVAEYDSFRQGKFTLPPKPIIITFDDGRKDSYYTTDGILKKLGFKATMFYASGPFIDGDSFYLGWDELSNMKKSGRWEIEAHGRYSHKHIPTNAEKVEEGGRYLNSRMYLSDKKRIETPEEFRIRVEKDYMDGIFDLRSHVGVNARYFAIPLNDYGESVHGNYPEAAGINLEFIKKYFRLAFIQSNSPDNVADVHLPVYNFADDDPYHLRRIEMKNMPAEVLKEILDREKPLPAKLTLIKSDFKKASLRERSTEGAIQMSAEGVSVQADAPDDNATAVFGQPHWQNYRVTADVEKKEGRSAVLLFYFEDSKNYLSFGYTDRGFFIRSTVEGVTKDLRNSIQGTFNPNVAHRFTAEIKNGKIQCFFNGILIFSNVSAPVPYGAVGFRGWSDTERAEVLMRALVVEPI